jgi:multiple sugar transport system ATP-binding protein
VAGLTVDRVTKTFGKTPALSNVSLEVKDGEFMVLLGPSGCGKTTLLRSVAGLERVDAGTVRIGTRDVTPLPPRDRNVAMVFQSYAVFPHMTVRSNIGFGLRMRKVRSDEIRRRVEDGARLLQLERFLDRYPAQLSGGQRQRVAVARALVMDADLLLMDEPLSNLDALLRLQARADLKRLHEELKRTTVYVTHDQVEAMSLGQRIAVMREGVIEQIGAPMDIYDNPASQFVGGFIGSPPMNFLRGVVRSGSFEGEGYSVALSRTPAKADGRPVLLGVRAEHMRIADGGLPARISVVEPLGSHALVTAIVGKTLIKVQAPIGLRAKPDDEVHLAMDEAMVRWMDAGSGTALDN